MLPWNVFINETTFASVLPHEYAYLARPLSEALAIFLGGLPSERQTAILTEQASLPATASPSQRLASLARCCPSLHKLGQVLARDHRLCLELREQLQELESLSPSLSLEVLEGILSRELGSLDRIGVKLEPPALAEASVATVIPFREKASSRQGVFKILKPEVEERLEQELELFQRVGEVLDQRCEELGIPQLDYQEAFQQVRDKLRHEIRLDLEQRHLDQAKRTYQNEPHVQIPALFPFCTPRITAMERVIGEKVTDHKLATESEKRNLAALVIKALIAHPLFSKERDAVFHADPHAGNLFFTVDQRLALLDWSLVGTLAEKERTTMTQVVLSMLTLHPERVADVLTKLGDANRVDFSALKLVTESWLHRIRLGTFPGFSFLMGMLDDEVQKARIRVSADLLLFRKTLLTLEEVLTDIGATTGQTNQVLLAEFLRHLVTEWPRRWFVLPDCRDFATRLSNADLVHALLHLPWTATQLWVDHFRTLVCQTSP